MKYIMFFIICLSLNAEDFNNVKLKRVYDGDTLFVDIPNTPSVFGKSIGIRVLGLDTPEIKGKTKCEKVLAYTAKKYVESLLKNANIKLKNCTRGKYFRLVCEVWYDNKSLTKELIKQGLAYEYYGKTKQNVNWCRR